MFPAVTVISANEKLLQRKGEPRLIMRDYITSGWSLRFQNLGRANYKRMEETWEDLPVLES